MIKEIIGNIEAQLDYIKEVGNKIQYKSFGYKEGVFITGEEAEYIIHKLNGLQPTVLEQPDNKFMVNQD